MPHTNQTSRFGSNAEIYDSLRVKYDYIIVDLSPVAPIVSTQAGNIMDTYVYVVDGERRRSTSWSATFQAQGVYDRLLGVVLNKVDMAAQSRYERYHGNHYYRKYYSKYGYVE